MFFSGGVASHSLIRLLRHGNASGLIGLEKGVFPLLVFLLTQESSLFDLEKSVPRDFFLYLDQ
jgi:hypothetical protein